MPVLKVVRKPSRCCSTRAQRRRTRSRPSGSSRLRAGVPRRTASRRQCRSPAAGHQVVDVPTKQKDRDQSTEQCERDPDPHSPLLFRARYLHRTPFADRRLHARRRSSMQVEVAEDPRHRTTLVGGTRCRRARRRRYSRTRFDHGGELPACVSFCPKRPSGIPLNQSS